MRITTRNVAYVVFAILLLLSFFTFLHFTDNKPEMSLSLIKPTFVQAETQTTFLDQEAGISIYTCLNQSIDLTRAKSVYRVIEKETSDYVVGSVPLPGLPGGEDVHVFIHKNGWIVVYYLKSEPTSKIVYGYSPGGTLENNKLQMGLSEVLGTLGVTATDVKYYHFQYPNANKMMIIVASLTGNEGDKNFTYQIPYGCKLFEGSWADFVLLKNDGIRWKYGSLDTLKVSYNQRHVVEIRNYCGDYFCDTKLNSLYVDGEELTRLNGGNNINYAYSAIVLIYNEP